jgi:hypothetical protein
LATVAPSLTAAHEGTHRKAQQQRRAALARAAARAEEPPQPHANQESCRLRVQLRNASDGQPLPGILRITNVDSEKAIPLPGEIHRELNWYAIQPDLMVTVPRTRIRVEAFHGLDRERVSRELDLTGMSQASVDILLRQFYDAKSQSLHSGNTHLHLMKMTYLEALEYLRTVPSADGLDLVFLSHLRRIPDERDYISNQVVENSFTGGELQRLSRHGVLFGNGEEHRHNFGRGGEGYGHVMLLDLLRLIQPVSIGPGIMQDGTDWPPLRNGIRSARADGATVIWCHNQFGLERLPNWMTGELHAQNIFDGGDHGSYEETFYRYLNLGLSVPFSTGTDWFIYDFSRVYVPVSEPLTTKNWLSALRSGKSYITNGPFLELTLDDRPIGDTVALDAPRAVTIRGRGIGRSDFRRIELVHNGEVVRMAACRKLEGHFVADLEFSLPIREPGWVALRIPRDAGKNELDKPLFAHTSAIYLELEGRRIFRPEIAREMITEIETNQQKIVSEARFANERDRDDVLRVHREGIESLRKRISQARP